MTPFLKVTNTENQIFNFNALTKPLSETDQDSKQDFYPQVKVNSTDEEEVASIQTLKTKRKKASEDRNFKKLKGSKFQKIRNQFRKMESDLKETKNKQESLDRNYSELKQRLGNQEMISLILQQQIVDLQATLNQRNHNFALLTISHALLLKRQLELQQLITNYFYFHN